MWTRNSPTLSFAGSSASCGRTPTRDAQLVDRGRLEAEDLDRALRRVEVAGHHRERRRLARAVRPDEAVDLPHRRSRASPRRPPSSRRSAWSACGGAPRPRRPSSFSSSSRSAGASIAYGDGGHLRLRVGLPSSRRRLPRAAWSDVPPLEDAATPAAFARTTKPTRMPSAVSTFVVSGARSSVSYVFG